MFTGTTGQVDVIVDFYTFNSNFRVLDTSGDQAAPYIIEVYLDNPIDRETLTFPTEMIPFTIYGKDRAFLPLERSYDYNISIIDFNDFPPVFENTPYTAMVSESAPIGELIIIPYILGVVIDLAPFPTR